MKQGFLEILPLAFGAALYGFAFGVLAAQVGFIWWGVGAMSSGVHAGSSQIVAVEQFGSGAGILGAVLAGAVLNLRYLGIVASLAPLLRGAPLWKRLVAIHTTGDENWALTMARRRADPSIGLPFLLGSGLTMISVWTVSTSVGALVGSALGDLERFGLGFAFTAAFIAMARALFKGRRDVVPWGVSFAVTVVLVSFAVPTAFGIVGGALAGAVCLVLRRRRGLVS